MRLTEILTGDCIVAPLQASDKTDAIRQLVHVLARTGRCTDESALLDAVLEREAIRSTGVGNGLAIPHAKSRCCTGLVMSIGKPPTPIDFDSNDGLPVDLIVLVASAPEQTGPHIQTLARISRLMLMESFRADIARAQDASQILEVVRRSEES